MPAQTRYLRWLTATLTLLILCLGSLATADDVDDCVQASDSDLSISGCTKSIASGRWKDDELAWAYYNRGIAYYRKGEHDRAIADYDKAIEINPDNALAYRNRGVAYRAKGDTDRAVADYNKAIEISPDQAVAASAPDDTAAPKENATPAKASAGRTLADFDRAIEVKPNDAVAYYNRGIAYYGIGDYDRAIADYDRAIELDPNHAVAYRSRGNAHFYKGAFELAVADLRRSAESGDVYGVLWLFMAQSHAGQDGAAELATKAATLNSTDWPLPVVDLYLGKQTADAILSKAGTANERCEASFYIGEWHLVQGRKDEAVPALRSAVETCPKSFIEYSGAVAELARIE